MAAIDRLLSILDLFTLDRPEWSVDAASIELEIPTSTAYRYFNALTRSGLLATIGAGQYVLGPSIIRYDRQLRLTDPLLRAARTESDRIAELVAGRGVLFLCRLLGDQVMCIAQATRGNAPYVVGYERGRLMPLYAGSASRVILAFLPPARIQSLYRANPGAFSARIGKDWEAVRTSLREVRAQGAFTTVGEVDPGKRGISAPIFNSGKVIGSLSVAGPRQNFNAAAVTALIDELKLSTARIGAELDRWVESKR